VKDQLPPWLRGALAVTAFALAAAAPRSGAGGALVWALHGLALGAWLLAPGAPALAVRAALALGAAAVCHASASSPAWVTLAALADLALAWVLARREGRLPSALASGLVVGAWAAWAFQEQTGGVPREALLVGPAWALAWASLSAPIRRALESEAARRRAAWVAAAAAHVALGAPWAPSMPRISDLDGSWQEGLHHALLGGWTFGVDVVFSFGPLGFVYTDQYVPPGPTASCSRRARCSPSSRRRSCGRRPPRATSHPRAPRPGRRPSRS
jgi:hypothetical protein